MQSQNNAQLDKVLSAVSEMKSSMEVDGVKVYFQSDSKYCVKCIKDGKIVKKYRKGNDSFDVIKK